MSKKQSRAAQLARGIQHATGLPYTRCLKMCEPSEGSWSRLAHELRTAGLIEAADHLLAVDGVATQAGIWFAACGEAEAAYRDTDSEQCGRAISACCDAAEAALHRGSFDTHSYDTEAEAFHSAFIALSKAGELPNGRPLAQAALGVFPDDPTWCSDVIRSRGRSPFTYTSAAHIIGPTTATAAAARKAACAMARAAAIPFKGDEEWYEAAGIMTEAIWHASEAAGLSPLQGHPNCRGHLQNFMNGEIPQP